MKEKLFSMIKNNESLLHKVKIWIKGFQLFDLLLLFTEHVPKKLGKAIKLIRTLLNEIESIIKSTFSFTSNPELVKDAIASIDSNNYPIAIDRIRNNGGVLTTVEMLLFNIQVKDNIRKLNALVQLFK